MVSILIVTFNSANRLSECLRSVRQQDYPALEIIVLDNASTDKTPELLKQLSPEVHTVLNESNIGFAAAQNQAIKLARGEWLLCLNPDVLLNPNFISELVKAGMKDASVGSICGKLRRWKPGANPERTSTIDSTGMYFLRNLRHLDRGAEEIDRGQYNQMEYVFGASGAAALYRRSMIEDVSVAEEFFDEDFFAYREDADLAWRAQILGWRCLYTPSAVAWHQRRVTPQRRRQLPLAINWHSVKNRFLMRMKNASLGLCLRLFFPIIWRDAMIAGYALLRDWRLISALLYPLRRLRSLQKKRCWIQSHRRVSDREFLRWFDNRPVSEPFSTPDSKRPNPVIGNHNSATR